MKTYGFAIVGCGGIAKIHADAIKNMDNAKIVAAYDYSYKFAQSFAETHNCIAYETIEQLLENPEVDIVNICTPSGLHTPIAVQVAKAKKHIIVEKPMSITREQLAEITKAVEENGVKVEVISQLRFTQSIIQTKNAIDSGALGQILHADYVMKYKRTQEYYDNGGWRGTWAMDGGGALMNQGIHGIDLLQYLVGGVKSVCADCRTLARKIETEDTANILVEYNCGAIGVIQCTTCCEPGYPRKITISGTKGTIVLKEDEIETWDIPQQEVEKGKSTINANANPLDFSSENHRLQFNDLIRSIEEDKEPLVGVSEGRKAVEIILSAYQSSKEGKKVIL